MSDTLKFVIKTILKVPIIVFVFYLGVNLVGFTLSYFKVLGVSYTVMQAGVENNYIPETEKTNLTEYFSSLETDVLDGIQFTEDTEFERKQYGETITVGVQANFKWILPLMPHDMTSTDNVVEGYNNTSQTAVWLTDSELQAERDERDKIRHNIFIEYTVPGLQYYPDME